MVDVLLDAGADIDGSGPDASGNRWGNPLSYAVNDETLYRHLIERGAGIYLNAYLDRSSLFDELVRLNSPKLLEWTLNKISLRPCDLSSNPKRYNSYFRISHSASLPCYQWLVEHGFDPNKRDEAGKLLLLNMSGSPELFSHLVDSLSPTVQELDKTLVHYGAITFYEDGDNIRKNLPFLLKRDANINAQNERGRTLLHETAENYWWADSEKVVAWLLQLGADPAVKDKKGKCPIDLVREGFRHLSTKQKIIDLLSAGKRPAQ